MSGGSKDPAIFSREEAGDGDSFTVTIECGLGNEYDGRMGLRISAIFVIFFGSILGCVIPLLLGRFYRHSGLAGAFFAARFFGSGVIVSTAFIHLLAPAIAALYSPCLEQDSPITTYAWPEAICLMSVFAMFIANVVGNHFVGKSNGLVNTTGNPPGSSIHESQMEQGISSTTKDDQRIDIVAEGHGVSTSFAAQMIPFSILEFGIIFHSSLVGLTLAVSGEEFIVLYIVLTFHQTFEGVGLGARLATMFWPDGKHWLPYVLSVAYSLSTPISLAVGLGVRQSFKPGSHQALVVSGIFDSIAAGILLYAGLVQLIGHDFFFSSQMRDSSIGNKMGAVGWMCLGAGLMALLGNWA